MKIEQKERVFEKAKSTFHTTLIFVGTQERLPGENRKLQNIDPRNPTCIAKDLLHDLSTINDLACLHLLLHTDWDGLCSHTRDAR